MSANKNNARKGKIKPVGARPTYFPDPTPENQQIVTNALQTGNALSSGNHQPPIQEVLVEPGSLYVHDSHAPADANTHHYYRPTLYDDLLAAIAGYKKFLTDAPGPNGTQLIDALREYVVVFAHGNLYHDAPRHALLIQKPFDSSLHPGMLNLPGGRVEPQESPHDAACREFYEETGWQCTMPQLMGVLIPSMYDFPSPSNTRETPYLVHCYRGIILTAEKQTARDDAHQLNVERHCPLWYLISDLGREKIVPNVACVVTHLATETRCWVIQDCWRCDDQQNDFSPTKDLLFNAQVPPRLRCQSQEIVTYYTPDRTLEARQGLLKKRRLNDA